MNKILSDLFVMVPWLSDPETEEVAMRCIRFASLAAYFRESKKPELVAAAAVLLRDASQASKIPHSVIERYCRGVEAVHVLFREECFKCADGGDHGE